MFAALPAAAVCVVTSFQEFGCFMQYLTLLLASQKMKTAWVSNPKTTLAAPRQSPYRSQQMKNVVVNLSSKKALWTRAGTGTKNEVPAVCCSRV